MADNLRNSCVEQAQIADSIREEVARIERDLDQLKVMRRLQRSRVVNSGTSDQSDVEHASIVSGRHGNDPVSYPSRDRRQFDSMNQSVRPPSFTNASVEACRARDLPGFTPSRRQVDRDALQSNHDEAIHDIAEQHLQSILRRAGGDQAQVARGLRDRSPENVNMRTATSHVRFSDCFGDDLPLRRPNQGRDRPSANLSGVHRRRSLAPGDIPELPLDNEQTRAETTRNETRFRGSLDFGQAARNYSEEGAIPRNRPSSSMFVPAGASTPVERPVHAPESLQNRLAAAQARQETPFAPANRPTFCQTRGGLQQSTTALSGAGLKPRRYDGKGDVDLFIRQFEQVCAVNGWDEPMSLVQLHHCLVGDAMSCGRHSTYDSTVRDLRARYGCRVREASRRLSSLRQGTMTVHELGDEINRLADVVFGAGLNEAQRVEYFLDALKSGEMRRMLTLTRPRSISDAIDTASELFWDASSSVRVVSEPRASEEADLAKQVKLLGEKLEKLISLTSENASKGKDQPSNDGQKGNRRSHTVICYTCGEVGHVRRFCPKRKAKPAATPNEKKEEISGNE